MILPSPFLLPFMLICKCYSVASIAMQIYVLLRACVFVCVPVCVCVCVIGAFCMPLAALQMSVF